MTNEDWVDRLNFIGLSAEITLKHILCLLPSIVLQEGWASVAQDTWYVSFSGFLYLLISLLNWLFSISSLPPKINSSELNPCLTVCFGRNPKAIPLCFWGFKKKSYLPPSDGYLDKEGSLILGPWWWTTESPLILSWLLPESRVVFLCRNMNKNTSWSPTASSVAMVSLRE